MGRGIGRGEGRGPPPPGRVINSTTLAGSKVSNPLSALADVATSAERRIASVMELRFICSFSERKAFRERVPPDRSRTRNLTFL